MRSITPKSLVPDKVKRRRFIALIKKIFIWIFILIACFQLYRANQLLSSASSAEYNKSLAEIETLNEEINRLKDYLLISSETESQALDSNNPFESELGQILKEYQQEVAQQTQLQLLQNTVNQNLPQNLPSGFELTNVQNSVFSILQEDSEILSFGVKNLKLFITTPYSYTEYKSNQLSQYLNRIKLLSTPDRLNLLAKVKLRVTQANRILSDLNNNYSDLVSIIEQKRLQIMPIDLQDSYSVISINTYDGNLAGSIRYNYAKGEFYALGQNNQEVSQRTANLSEVVSSITTYFSLNNFESLLSKNIKQKNATILKYIESSNFQKMLADSNLTFSMSDTEDSIDYIFVNKSTNQEVFIIYINKSDASIYFKKDEKLRKLSFKDTEYIHSSNDKTYLIAGKHGELTDTMILANVNDSLNTIKLLSVPRDLYVDGQKINSVYTKEGMSGLTSKLEQVTGLKIENYALIDMYAFIDVVDYLGGISVYLDQDIIDPTYKTFDNGVWGTMYFAAGEHTINGKQALRLARSRYTTSDFDRAKRQQAILASAKNKLKELSLKDAKTIVQIAYTVLEQTETDFTPQKAITSYFKYKDFSISGQNVLSTANVLASTYSNEYQNNKCKNCGRGAYILVPKNNDWSLVKTYVQQLVAS